VKKKAFELSYIGTSTEGSYGVVYHKMGDYSVVLSIVNPVVQFSGDESNYTGFHTTMANVYKLLGEGYTIQKNDIMPIVTYKKLKSDDFLGQKYFDHFDGRTYRDVQSLLIITKNVTRSTFFQYSGTEFEVFLKKTGKVISMLRDSSFKVSPLGEGEIKLIIKRRLANNFSDDVVRIQNFKVTSEHIEFGKNILKTIPLVNIDRVDLPLMIGNTANLDIAQDFPVDIMSFLHNVPNCELLIYNQVVTIPDQRKEITKLEGKKRKHSSVPDPGNDVAVEDIESVLILIQKTNELLVYSHYDIMLYGTHQAVESAGNFISGKLFNLGIIPSDNYYNQKELFMSSMPGHTNDLKGYDRFFTTSDPSVCFMYKESLMQGDSGNLKIYLTDRIGIPVAVDMGDKIMESNRVGNRNKFVLGPSGSGKSFFMNTTIKQYYDQGMDIVLVDTGHSYSGLCEYYGGKYITYSEKKPIAMNPFKIGMKEINEEKKDFLKSLVGLLWKGSDGNLSQVEDSMLINIISSYYRDHFTKNPQDFTEGLGFNGFYDYSVTKMRELKKSEEVVIDIAEYAFVLRKFYKGGEYQDILNSDVDKSLFDENFIVFEVDNIKDNKILFPITTLIIMDVFLQKMLHKASRKALIIEEAWKAIASPMMASYILYVYKTCRKHWGEAIVVTQELDDILGNKIVKDSIINNSDTIILLDQTKFMENYDQIANLLNINQVERNKVFTINQLDNKKGRGRFKEVYIKRGSHGEVYGVEESDYGYMTFTTEKNEKAALEIYRRSYGSFREALEHFVRDKNESGLSTAEYSDRVLANPKLLETVEI